MTQQSPNFPLNVPMSWSQVWIRVLTQPSPITFQAVLTDPTASNRRAYTWTAVVSLIEIGFALLVQVPMLSRFPSKFPTSRGAPVLPSGMSILAIYLCLLPVAPLLAVLGLIINVAITQFIAKMLGGVGTYDALTYAFAAYQAPMALISSILAVSPLGFCLALPLGIYSLVLHLMAVKGVNEFSYGKAFLSVFMLPLLLFGLALTMILLTLAVNSVHR